MIKLLIFLMIKMKLDIIFAILVVSYYVKNLNYFFAKIVKTILKYLKKAKKQAIIYN